MRDGDIMDIVIVTDSIGINYLKEKSNNKDDGFEYFILKKRPKRLKIRNNVFVCCDERIQGRYKVMAIDKINEDTMQLTKGILWQSIGKMCLTVLPQHWFEKPIVYKKKIECQDWRYVDMTKYYLKNGGGDEYSS